MSDEQGRSESVETEVTIEQFEKVIAATRNPVVCRYCGGDQWFYPSDDDVHMIPVSFGTTWPPFLMNGLSLYHRACVDCGGVETFSRALIRIKVEGLQGRTDE